MSSTSKKRGRGRPRIDRRIRLEVERPDTTDYRKLARALIGMAQIPRGEPDPPTTGEPGGQNGGKP